VNIGRGEQFRPEFLAISPNNRMPAIVDHAPMERGDRYPSSSPAQFCCTCRTRASDHARDLRGRVETTQWLFWQWADSGHGGSESSFLEDAPRRFRMPSTATQGDQSTVRSAEHPVSPTGIHRRRLLIADMAAYPWIVPHEAQGQNLDDFPHLKRWFEAIKSRPATVRAYERGAALSAAPTATKNRGKFCSVRRRGPSRKRDFSALALPPSSSVDVHRRFPTAA